VRTDDPAPRRPDPRLVRDAGRQIGRFALLVVCSLLCMSLDLPWQAAALLFSVPAVAVGLLALRDVVRAGMGAAAITFTVVGTLLAGLMVIGQVATIALPPVRELQECRAEALSPSAERECQRDYERRLDDIRNLSRSR
jgi:hypothetical protein